MDIEWEEEHWNMHKCEMPAIIWIESRLQRSVIELQITRLQKLVALLAERSLVSDQSLLKPIAEAIKCEGFNHKIKSSDDFI